MKVNIGRPIGETAIMPNIPLMELIDRRPLHSPCRAALATSLAGQHMPQRIHPSLTPLFRRASMGTVKMADRGKPAGRHGHAIHQNHPAQRYGRASLQLARWCGWCKAGWLPPPWGPAASVARSVTFPLERDGAILTAADIQARTGGSDAG